jgi:hypothetical protein
MADAIHFVIAAWLGSNLLFIAAAFFRVLRTRRLIRQRSIDRLFVAARVGTLDRESLRTDDAIDGAWVTECSALVPAIEQRGLSRQIS